MPAKNHVDLRIQKTERALMDALSALLGDRGFDEITVSDLCDEAMVRRATFYKHFQDKYDFMAFCVKEQGRRLALPSAEDAPCDPAAAYEAACRQAVGFLKENRPLAENALRHASMPDLLALFDRQFAGGRGCESGAPPPGDTAEAMRIACIAGATIGLLHWWLRAGKTLDEESLVQCAKEIFAAYAAADLPDARREPEDIAPKRNAVPNHINKEYRYE